MDSKTKLPPTEKTTSSELVLKLRVSLAPAVFPVLVGSLILGFFIAIFSPIPLFVCSRGLTVSNIPSYDPTCRTIVTIATVLLFAILFTSPVILNLRSRVYSIYTDRIEWYEGFFTLNKKTTYLKKVTDLLSQRGILDRIFGTGTIAVKTAGSFRPEIIISYIRDTDEVYKTISELWKKEL